MTFRMPWRSIDALGVEEGPHLFVEAKDVSQEPVVGDVIFRIEGGTLSFGYGIADMVQVPEQQLVLLVVFLGLFHSLLFHQLFLGCEMEARVFV